MKSKNLLNQLVKELGNEYQITKASGVTGSKLSGIRNGKRNFNGDELLMLVDAGLITKTQAYKTALCDKISDPENLSRVASIAAICPAVMAAVREVCILCQIPGSRITHMSYNKNLQLSH